MAKRPHEAIDHDSTARKKRIVAHEQRRPEHVELAPQTPSFTGGQLLRSIAAALRLAGFDSAMPSALEMFRAQAEEFMLQFARQVRVSMLGQRRTKPVAQDFVFALAHTTNTRAARVLKGQLDLKLPQELSSPDIADPPPALPPIPDLSSLLRPLVKESPPVWIPKHFPQLPSQHSWKSTDVWPVREQDARKMREKATEEGMLAEQALRKLAQAARPGGLQRASRDPASPADSRARTRRRDNDALLGSILREFGGATVPASDDVRLDGASDVKDEPFELAGGVKVDSDAAHWRGGGRHGVPV